MSDGQDIETAVKAVLNGDTAAFSSIVERWQGPLVNLAYRFCRDHERAEDMAQEAFIRAYRGLASWRRDAAFSTWLFAVATNVYRDEIRKFTPPSVPVEADDLGAEKSEEDAADEADRRRLVRAAVQSLPAKYRDVLLLFYFHEQNVAAAAASLRLPEGTIKARLSRGRALLESKLEKRL